MEVCECELVYAVNSMSPGLQQQQQQQQQPRQRQFIAFASVNCSHRGFTDMPSFLPANTTTLHLEGNRVRMCAYLRLYLLRIYKANSVRRQSTCYIYCCECIRSRVARAPVFLSLSFTRHTILQNYFFDNYFALVKSKIYFLISKILSRNCY